MVKKLIILGLVGTLTLAVGCNKVKDDTNSGEQVAIEKEKEDTGTWEGMAKGEMEASENQFNKINEIYKERFEGINLYPYTGDNGLHGYMNSKGETIVEPQFSRVEDFSYINGVDCYGDDEPTMLARVFNSQDRNNYLTVQGELLVDGFNHQALGEPEDGLVAFWDGLETYGIIDFQGNVILEEYYEEIKICDGGYMALLRDGKWGLSDREGNVILDHTFDSIYERGTAFEVSINEKYGVYNKAGEEIIPVVHDYIEYLADDLYMIMGEDDKYIIYDEVGEILSQGVYNEILPLNKGLYGAKDNSEKYALYNSKGEKISDHIYDQVMYQGETMIKVIQDDEHKYINEKGEIIIDRSIVGIPYEELKVATDPRYAHIKVDGKWGVIDMEGEYLLEPKYDAVNMGYRNNDGTLIKDCFIVEEDGKRNLINEEGEILREDFYEGATIGEDGITAFNQDYTMIIVDLKGNELGKYKHIVSYEEYILVTDNIEDKYGYIVNPKTGEVMSEEKYERIYTDLDSDLVIGTKDDNIYIMTGDCKITTEFSSFRYGYDAGNIEIYDENLIKLNHYDGAIHWINRKGQLIK